jgi:hypothetical protein
MKQYTIEPKMKKSVVEEMTFRKKVGETTMFLTKQLTWRSGSFTIYVPETEEEIEEWLETRGWSMDDWGEYVTEDDFLPNEDDDCVELDNYEYEMDHTWDGVSEDFELSVFPAESLSEEEQEELLEAAQELYYEDYEEGLFEDGWEESGFCTYIYNGLKITEGAVDPDDEG